MSAETRAAQVPAPKRGAPGQEAPERGAAKRGALSVAGSWLRDLTLGARFVVTGGREGWTRTVLTVVGVGLGVAMLLAAAATPVMLAARHDRTTARDEMNFDAPAVPGERTVLVSNTDTMFRGEEIRGRIMQAEGSAPVTPPGVSRLPAPGEMLVSPALRDLLESSDGALLRPRLPYRVVGTIGDEGLAGPRERAYLAGGDMLRAGRGTSRLDHFGNDDPSEGLDSVLTLLVVIILVVLLLPIAVFVAAAVRFGGERRDRRLAALRLVGADGRMTRRIAAGEAAVGALLGLFAGGLFFMIGRLFVERFELQGISVYGSDVRPVLPLLLLITVAVPLAAVGVTVISLRRVVIEPLGVVRHATGRRRRLWWRLVLPVAGLALLYPLRAGVDNAGDINGYQVAAGAVLLLVGITAVLPWLVETVVRLLGGAGAVPWQLAMRRLQLDAGASTRMINGIAVAAAGGIALQMLFGAVDQNYRLETGQDPHRAQAQVSVYEAPSGAAETLRSRLTIVPGVRDVRVLRSTIGMLPGPDGRVPGKPEDRIGYSITVADCATLGELATMGRCADGDVFFADDAALDWDDEMLPRPGARLILDVASDPAADAPSWTVPEKARRVPTRLDPSGTQATGVLATPKAMGGLLRDSGLNAYVRVASGEQDVYDHIRNAAASVDAQASVSVLSSSVEKPRFASIRRGLFIGVVLTLLLIGASLLVTMLEQLRERRRLLAVLIAFGTRRTTLIWSVLWQTAVPVFFGLALAMAAGAGLGAMLLTMVSEKIRFDWASMLQIAGAGAGVVLVVTALSLPALWRMMRPDGLRTE